MAKCVLGDVAKRIQTGPFGSQLHQADYSPSGTPVVMPKDLADGTIVDATIARVGPQHVERLAKHKLKEGDLLFSRRGDVGRCALVRKEQEGWLCGTGCLRVELDSEKADYNYLYYFLRRDDVAKWLESHAVGAIMLNINPSIVSQLSIALPPIDVQRNIAKVLSAIDRKIALNRKRIATLEAMAKEIYDYWFVQFDFPDAHGRPYKSSGGAMVYNPDLKREIPKGWEVKQLGVLTRIILGGTPATEESRYWEGGTVPWLSSGEMANFPVLTSEKKITELAIKNSATDLMPSGSVALSITRYIRPTILAIEACANQSVVGVLETEQLHNSLIYPYLVSQVPRFLGLRTGAQQPHINKDTVSGSMLSIAATPVLQRYYNLVDPVYGNIMIAARNMQKLEGLREMLLPLLMNGQVKVG